MAEPGAHGGREARAAAEVRVVTYNTAAGNPRIATDQADFVRLPFYREALADAPGAPILALQEVGPAQARALRRAAVAGRCTVLQVRRPGLGNALVIPGRYAVLARRRGYYAISHLRGVADALSRRGRRRDRRDPRQFGELRSWLEARLRDHRSGRELTVITTHLSVDPSLKVAQGRAVVARALRASRHGPVVLAGDLNVPRGRPRGRDAELATSLASLADVGGEPPPGRPDIDYVLAIGMEPVRSRVWTDASLALPGSPDAAAVSDHYARDVVLRFAAVR